MKNKILLFLILLSSISFAQVSNGGEQEFDYGIKNNASTEIATPPFLVSQGIDGTYGKMNRNNVIEYLEFASAVNLPVTGEQGKLYLTKDNNRLYRFNGTIYQELTTDISGKEDIANKQNSLAVDGTSEKYPTVDAINLFKNNLGSAAYKNAGTNDGDVPILYRSPSGEPQIRFSGNGINVLSLKNTSDSEDAYSTLAFSEVGSDTGLTEKGAVGIGKTNSLLYPWRSVYLESFANSDNDLLPIRLVQSTTIAGINYRNWRRIDIEASGVSLGDISFYSGSGLNYPNETTIFKMLNNGNAYINRHLGIGTLTPSSVLTVYTADSGLLGQIRMGFSDIASWTIGRETDVDGRFTITKGTDVIEKLSISPAGVVKINNLAGSENRMVSADSAGNLSAPDIPTAPTAPAGTNTTQIATTAFVLANGGATSGTFTPTYTAGLNVTAVSGDQNSFYTKIGNIVTVTYRFQVSATTGNATTTFSATLPINKIVSNARVQIGTGSMRKNDPSDDVIINVSDVGGLSTVYFEYYNGAAWSTVNIGSVTFQYNIAQ